MTVANLVVPNTINEDLSRPSGFPNGRRLTDPVIDLTLGFLFIDIGKHGVDALAKIPLNPAGNDQPFRAAFPYLAPPQGNPPGLTPGGTTFSFRSDPVSSYVKVDRMGMPAVATAVIGSSPQDRLLQRQSWRRWHAKICAGNPEHPDGADQRACRRLRPPKA